MDQYLGEIKTFAFPFPPKGWALCNGATLSIMQNQALFSLLGVYYGGDGITTFKLPDFRGRVILGQGNGGGGNYNIGDSDGVESTVLAITEIPQHNHMMQVNNAPGPQPLNMADDYLAGFTYGPATGPTNVNSYVSQAGSPVTLINASITSTGGNQPHENRQPYLVMNVCIAIQGIFPSRD